MAKKNKIKKEKAVAGDPAKPNGAVPIEQLPRTVIAVLKLANFSGSIVALGKKEDANLILNLVLPINGEQTAIPFDVPAAIVVRELLDAMIKNSIGGFVPEAAAPQPPVAQQTAGVGQGKG